MCRCNNKWEGVSLIDSDDRGGAGADVPRSNDNVAARKLLQRRVLNKLSFGKALGCRGTPINPMRE